MSSFVVLADVKARCSIEQAAKLLDLKCTEREKPTPRACPACRNGGPRAIVITPAKNLFHCFSSKTGGDQIALVSHVKGVSQKDAAALMLGAETKGTVQSTSTVQNGTSTVLPTITSRRSIIWNLITSWSNPSRSTPARPKPLALATLQKA
jgi:hypothetical protein